MTVAGSETPGWGNRKQKVTEIEITFNTGLSENVPHKKQNPWLLFFVLQVNLHQLLEMYNIVAIFFKISATGGGPPKIRNSSLA